MRPIQQTLETSLAEMLGPLPELEKLCIGYSAAVGEQIARHTRPMGYDSGCLTLSADSTEWKMEVERNAALMGRRLTALLGVPVRQITVTIGDLNGNRP